MDGCSLLDVGCGPGGFAAYVNAKKPNLKITLLDKSELAVELAREQGFQSKLVDLTQQPLDESYDYIACFEVVEHAKMRSLCCRRCF